ncbi:MAG: hypothetical protein IKN31_00530 [Bacteroidales bacterium]|nr:hypothetical protein [Bacteroidales bacterium]
MKKISFLLIILILNDISIIAFADSFSGQRIQEIEFSLLSRYSFPKDKWKLEAAKYLLTGLPQQWHYDPSVLEETGVKIKVMDAEVIDADYLAENIEYAFRAWELPWARNVSFEDFCRYLLPYKMGNEAPERWRAAVWEEYASLREAAIAEPGIRPSEVCRRVDAFVNTWYTVHYNDNYPTDAGYLKAKELRGGTCNGASLMILYPLRALGVCATYECVPHWGNRSSSHAWNALYENGQLIQFNGPELDPGRTKEEFIGVGRMLRKRPKVLRKDYLSAGRIDVTTEYIPTADLDIRGRGEKSGKPGLMVFDNERWCSVAEGTWRGRWAVFAAVARGVAFLPVVSENGHGRALGWPLVVERNGRLKLFRPSLWRRTVRLTAKYPEDESNAVSPGKRYELFYWRGGWVSLGVQQATDTVLVCRRVPKGALLLLRDLDSDKRRERIFAYEKGKQIWY